MNMKKLLATTSMVVAIGTMSFASPNVMASQQMLNQLGYQAGPTDGLTGNLTTTAIENFYADSGKVFDGTIDANEITDLKLAVSEMPALDFETQKKNGMITTFGNYISPDNMVSPGTWRTKRYFLPGDFYMREYQGDNQEIFWTITGAFANLNGDNTPDLVMGFELHNQCRGKFESDGNIGTWKCGDEKMSDIQQRLPFALFEIGSMSRKDLVEQIVVNNHVSPRNSIRTITADFNGDGIDDIYSPSAYKAKVNGKHQYGGADLVFLSNGKGQWIETAEKGVKIDKNGTFHNFSHGATAADIDNDGDIDVIVSDVQWSRSKGGGNIWCHVNDGKGIFTVKKCGDQWAHALTTGDYNGDGHVDLMASGGWHQSPAYKHDSSLPQQQTVILFGDSSGYFGKKKRTSMESANDIFGSGFLLTDVIGPVSWDFDNDGDVDIAGSNIGPLYVGGTTTIWANDGKGNFTVADQTPLIPSPDFVKTRKGFKKGINMETNAYNSFCTRNVLIDVNNDGLMDIMCQGSPQDVHSGWFFVNQGNLEFKKVSPYQAWENEWVDFYKSEYGGQNRKFTGFPDADMMEPGGYCKYKSDF